MPKKHQLEPLEDGFVAFRTETGERWKHRDLTEGRVGEGYRVFISDDGEERRYRFSTKEVHDATIFDLREQLKRAEPASGESRSESASGEARAAPSSRDDRIEPASRDDRA
jgi:hypothetical protein